jgi:hypothetical protein
MQNLDPRASRESKKTVIGLSGSAWSYFLAVFIALGTCLCTSAETARLPDRQTLVWPTDLVYEGMASYGNYRVFGAAENAKLYTAGVELDRELWPRVFRARVDGVMEYLPVVLLTQPTKTDFWGDPLSRDRKIVPGVGVTPIGFRLLWRDGMRVMPYFETKGSVLGFTQKALSPDATYENWSFHLTHGVIVRLRGRYDLRLGMLSDLHFSNAFVVRSNPALDVMNVDLGLVYHMGGASRHGVVGQEDDRTPSPNGGRFARSLKDYFAMSIGGSRR